MYPVSARTTPERIPIELNRRFSKGFIPFELTLGFDSGSPYVTVGEGYVYERALSALAAENSLVLHPCDNRLDVSGDPTKFSLTVGQAIFVVVKDDEFGRILGGEDLLLGVAPATQESYNFIPGVEEGVTYYKLGELVEDADGGVRIEPFLTGSHICHSTGLTADMRIMDCGLYGDPIQLLRLSFVSGKLHSVNESEESRPLAEATAEVSLPDCSSLPTSMP
jgi:hypothetical protein